MRVIDSHTAGEPTRVVLRGGPELGSGSVATRAAKLQSDHRAFYSSVLLEPRGHDAMVGALLVEPFEQDCAAGVIYFNPAGNLGMCGHATIGLAVTLAHLDIIGPGVHRIETPVGIVSVELHDRNTASVVNVESYRLHKDVCISVEGWGEFRGDIAWGGNWFFLVKGCPIPIEPANIRTLTDLALVLRDALEKNFITGHDGARIDHIELFGPPGSTIANSRNFVLCPGGAYDRSPCGTGCSAKLACLAADGEWPAERVWVQESVIGSTYRVSYRLGLRGGVIPTITGQAFVTAETILIFDPSDPYRAGICA